MSNPFSKSSTGASTGNLSERSDKTNQPIARYFKPRIHVIVGIASAMAGAAILAFSTQYFLFHPMTPTDEYVGGRMWIVGSWLLGGGVTLTFARPWVAALVGFFAPAFTFAIAILLYFALILLGPLLS